MEFIGDPYLSLYLPLWLKDGGSFISSDMYGHVCTRIGALWTPQGHKFDGVDDYINCGNADAIAYLPSGHSFVVWINFSSIAHTASDIVLGVESAGAGGRQWALWGEAGQAGRLVFYVIKADGSVYIGRKMSATSACVAGVWACIAGTWSGGTTSASVKIYKNGVQVDDTDFEAGVFTGITDTGSNFTIGAGHAGVQFTPATYGEVFLYSRVLTLSELHHLYMATRGRYGV